MSSDGSNLLEALLDSILEGAGEHAGVIGLAAFFYYGSLLEYLHNADFLGFVWGDLAKFFGLATIIFLIMLVVLYFVLEKAVCPALARALRRISDPKRRENWESGLGFGVGALIIVLFAVGCLWCWAKVYAGGSQTKGPALAGDFHTKDGPAEGAEPPVAKAFPKPRRDHSAEARPSSEISSSRPSVGPSFDCAKATYRSEHLVCSSLELAVLDLEMANAYRDAAARVGTKSRKSALRGLQNYWLRNVREACADVVCLRSAYEQRIRELKGIQP